MSNLVTVAHTIAAHKNGKGLYRPNTNIYLYFFSSLNAIDGLFGHIYAYANICQEMSLFLLTFSSDDLDKSASSLLLFCGASLSSILMVCVFFF